MNVDNFWKRVRHELRAQKITQKNFARLINVPYSTFNSWQYYRRSVEVGTAYEIAKALGTTLEYLVTGAGKQVVTPMIVPAAASDKIRNTSKAEMTKLISKLQRELTKV